MPASRGLIKSKSVEVQKKRGGDINHAGLGQQVDGTSSRKDFMSKFKNIIKTLILKILSNFSSLQALFMTRQHLRVSIR